MHLQSSRHLTTSRHLEKLSLTPAISDWSPTRNNSIFIRHNVHRFSKQVHGHVSSVAISTLNFCSSTSLFFLFFFFDKVAGNMAHPASIHASSRKTDQSSLDMSLTAPQEKHVGMPTYLIQLLSMAKTFCESGVQSVHRYHKIKLRKGAT